jgi:hypothetical protein
MAEHEAKEAGKTAAREQNGNNAQFICASRANVCFKRKLHHAIEQLQNEYPFPFWFGSISECMTE